MKIKIVPLISIALSAALSGFAGLSPVNVWTGNVGLSLDGVGSNLNPAQTVRAEIPVGANVLAAYLYTAGVPYPWYLDAPTSLAHYNSAGITLAGSAVTFTELVGATAKPARPELGDWFTARADVTSLVSSLASGGGIFDWAVNEGRLDSRIDGSVLAVVYQHSSLAESSIALLDGGLKTVGETAVVNFAEPLSGVGEPGFFANMSIATSFSYPPSQTTTIDINGQRLTTSAGGSDDGQLADGGLITVGGLGDSIANPTNPYDPYAPDDELYGLTPFLANGDTSFSIHTINPSNDDNLFFMALHVSGKISDVEVEDPRDPPGVPDTGATLGLMAASLALVVAMRRRVARD